MSKNTGKRRTSGGRRRQAQRGGGTSWVVMGVIIGVLVIGAGLAINLIRQGGTIEGLQSFGALPGGLHVSTPVNYAQRPPVGGEHYPTWQNCGIYDQPIEDEYAVHSLEHGAVWLTYQPSLPAAELEQLRGLARGRSYTLVSPYPDQAAPITASAWGYQLSVDSASDSRLGQFIARFRQGPQTPEPGAVCVGGTGAPVER